MAKNNFIAEVTFNIGITESDQGNNFVKGLDNKIINGVYH